MRIIPLEPRNKIMQNAEKLSQGVAYIMSPSTIKKLIVLVIIIVIIAVAAALWFNPSSPLPPQVKIDTTNQPVLGKADAKIHIIAFEDLKCGNCKRFNTTLLPQMKKKYIDTGIADYTMINLAFIPGSMPAANAARCLYAQNKDFFFPFVDYLYNNQPDESEDWATIPKLMEFASHIPGVDQEKLSNCIFESRYTAEIENNLKIAQQAMTGDTIATPMVYINGRVVNPLLIDRVDALIEAAKKD